MPVFSKIASPNYDSPEDDVPPYATGSLDAWSRTPLSNNHAAHSGQNMSARLSEALPRPRARYTDPAIRHTVSHQPAHHDDISGDGRARSHISISSDSSDDPNPQLMRLRRENTRLRVECGQLRGEIAGITNAYAQLLGSVNQNVTMTKEDVKKMVDHVIAYLEAPTDRASRLADDSIPAEPREEDYIHLAWWRQQTWQHYKNGTGAPLDIDVNSPIINCFFEDQFGNPISPGIKAAVRKDLFSYWNDMHSRNEVLTNHLDTGLARREDFRKTFEAKYPWLRLCEGHWKVDQLWINYFSSWKRPRTSVTPEKHDPIIGEQPPLAMSSLKTTREEPASSKRRFEDAKDPHEDPSKRRRVNGFDATEPTNFIHARPPPRKKISAKVARMSSSSSAAPPRSPIIRDMPVASGSGTRHSSPLPPFWPTNIILPPRQPSHVHFSNHIAPPTPQPFHPLPTISNNMALNPPTPSLSNVPPAISNEIIPDSQVSDLPDNYTPPPEFTPIEPAANSDSSITESSTDSSKTPDPVEPSKKTKGRIPYKKLICESWVEAGWGDKKAFNKYWGNLTPVQKKAETENKKSELARAPK